MCQWGDAHIPTAHPITSAHPRTSHRPSARLAAPPRRLAWRVIGGVATQGTVGLGCGEPAEESFATPYPRRGIN